MRSLGIFYDAYQSLTLGNQFIKSLVVKVLVLGLPYGFCSGIEIREGFAWEVCSDLLAYTQEGWHLGKESIAIPNPSTGFINLSAEGINPSPDKTNKVTSDAQNGGAGFGFSLNLLASQSPAISEPSGCNPTCDSHEYFGITHWLLYVLVLLISAAVAFCVGYNSAPNTEITNREATPPKS